MRRPRRAPAPLRTPGGAGADPPAAETPPAARRAGEPAGRHDGQPGQPPSGQASSSPSGISRRPPRPTLPRRRRGPPGPGSRPSPGASLRARVPLGQEGSGPARSPHRPPTPDHPLDPVRTPTGPACGPAAGAGQGPPLRLGPLGQEPAPGLELAPGQGRRRRRAPRHGPPRTPRSAWSGQARRIRAHRSRVLPGGAPPYPTLRGERGQRRPGPQPAPDRAPTGPDLAAPEPRRARNRRPR